MKGGGLGQAWQRNGVGIDLRGNWVWASSVFISCFMSFVVLALVQLCSFEEEFGEIGGGRDLASIYFTF